MHIVFVVGSYYPNYSAVGKCASNIAEELAKSNKVTVISLKDYFNQNENDEINNQKILRVTTKDLVKEFKLNDKIESSKGFIKSGYIILNKLNKVFRNFNIIFSKTTINQNLVESYINGLTSISHPIDTIIPVCMPYEGVIASIQYKKKYNNEVKVIPYLFDQFVENDSLHRLKLIKILKRNAHSKLEKNTVENSDSILILKQLNSYYMKHYEKFMKKVHVVEHPLLKLPNVTVSSNNNKTKFVYAGSFYKNIRNPKYMLDVFTKIFEKSEGELNIYSFGDCDRIIENYTYNKSEIKSFGKISNDKIPEKLINSDFLVALGNKDDKQVPSKIFEYFTYGKPIIYFYTNSNDKNLEVLEKYKLAICVNQNSDNKTLNSNRIINFCKNNVDERLSFEEIKHTFLDATPEYTVKKINSLIR
ncbi:hypothetical protein [Exiguobacterium sp. s5]|uniref:hypothetical protein n=1 Tax=Exiguobacterium sp. s5 TaxID=2751239 RepID=UPI001BE635B1|nr:hypothetical protein [Exiguobacterium sp. s5]